jgi:hypothetical protein
MPRSATCTFPRQHQIMAADRLTDRRVSRIVGAGARERC